MSTPALTAPAPAATGGGFVKRTGLIAALASLLAVVWPCAKMSRGIGLLQRQGDQVHANDDIGAAPRRVRDAARRSSAFTELGRCESTHKKARNPYKTGAGSY